MEKPDVQVQPMIVPLEDATTDVRLFRIEPATSDDLMLSSLTAFKLAVAPTYTAISYTCGTPIPTKTVWINAYPFEVGLNCHFALSQVRQYGEYGYIWLDCICINQQDLAEKSKQVQMMGKIFNQAAQVLVSLGPEADQSQLVCRFLDHERLPPFQGSGRWLEAMKEQVGVDHILEVWASGCAIANRPYWGRVWIFQELLLARSVVLLCGTERILDSRFFDLMNIFCYNMPKDEDYFGDAYDRIAYPVQFLSLVYNLTNRDTKLYRGNSIDLVSLIRSFANSQCSEPLDRIYGYLDVIKWPDPSISPPKVDYTISKVDLVLDCLGRMQYLEDDREEMDVTTFARYLLIYMRLDVEEEQIEDLLDRRRQFYDEYSTEEHNHVLPVRGTEYMEHFKELPSPPSLSSLLRTNDHRVKEKSFTTNVTILFAAAGSCFGAHKICGTSSNQESLFHKVRLEDVELKNESLPERLRMKPVLHQKALVAVLCSRARPGDYLLLLEPIRIRRLLARPVLIIRTHYNRLYEVVGQGLWNDDYYLCNGEWCSCDFRGIPHADEEGVPAFEIYFSMEDALAFAANNLSVDEELVNDETVKRPRESRKVLVDQLSERSCTSVTSSQYSSFVIEPDSLCEAAGDDAEAIEWA